nr:MAG TPA: hypothetical protein [Caudoviricetes sp.]
MSSISAQLNPRRCISSETSERTQLLSIVRFS